MPASVRRTTIQPIILRELHVLRVGDVTPAMRRVVLGGEQLGRFERDGMALPAFVSDGFDDHVKLFFADPVTGVLSLPEQRGSRLRWPDDPPALARSYTVRAYDAERREVVVDFAIQVAGVATEWSLRCRPGDAAWFAGPKTGMLLPEDTDWLLLAGDDTALPAIARCLEELPAGARAQVLVEVAGPASEQDLRTDADVAVRWLHRGESAPGTTRLLEDAIRGLQWWPGQPFAWVTGETMTLRPIREHLRVERGVPRERLDIAVYWRLRDADPADAQEDAGHGHALQGLGEVVAPYAVRAAVTLGVGQALVGGPLGAADLATVCGAAPSGLRRLLRWLASHGLVEECGGAWALTAAGSALHDDEAAELDLRRPLARLQLAVAGILQAVRTGGPVVDVDALRDGDPELEAAWAHAARDEAFSVAPSFGEEVVIGADERVLCCGDGVLALVEAALRADPGPKVALLALPSRVEGALAALPEGLRCGVDVVHGSELDGWPAGYADTVVVRGLLGRLRDADAAHALANAVDALRPGGRILAVERVLDDTAGDEHVAEQDLRMLCLHGTGLRTRDDWSVLFGAVGLMASEVSIGWGEAVFALTP